MMRKVARMGHDGWPSLALLASCGAPLGRRSVRSTLETLPSSSPKWRKRPYDGTTGDKEIFCTGGGCSAFKVCDPRRRHVVLGSTARARRWTARRRRAAAM